MHGSFTGQIHSQKNNASIAVLQGLFLLLLTTSEVTAGIVQWRVRVPAGADNPTNIGSYSNTIEIGNGGTAGYDPGLDVEIDTSIVPNNRFFVSYIDQNPNKVEYEFTQELQPGESYTAFLSFENNGGGGFALVLNTVEFLAGDGNFTYDLSVDTNDNGSVDTFRSGTLADVLKENGELEPWYQGIFQGNDHRNGWHYGTLIITAGESLPTSTGDFDLSGIVDSEDLSHWEAGYGMAMNATLRDGDSDADFDVDGADFLHWQRQVGNQAPISSSRVDSLIQKVPEPRAERILGIIAMMGSLFARIKRPASKHTTNR